MILLHLSVRKDAKLSSEYQNLKRRLDESIYKEQARQKILKAKREEKRAIKKAGGGHAIAKVLMSKDTDFEFGHNNNPHTETREDIDRRIAEQAASRCMGRVACQLCGKFHGYCIEVEEEKERTKMLPTGDNNDSSKNRARTGGLNFLNAQDLTSNPQEAKVLMVRYTEKGKSGPSITLKIAFKGDIRYLWVPARKSDPRYATLLNAFGPDENNWVDQRINLFLEKDDFSENYVQRIAVPKEKPAARSSRG